MNIYYRIVDFLSANGVPFREITHAPEGRTDLASAIRGHCITQAAKAMVVEVRGVSANPHYVLAVVPGHRKVALKRLARTLGGSRAQFAAPETAAALTGCVMGAVPPLSFNAKLGTIMDRGLMDVPEIVFNAGRLDRSFVLATSAYLGAVMPRVGDIAD